MISFIKILIKIGYLEAAYEASYDVKEINMCMCKKLNMQPYESRKEIYPQGARFTWVRRGGEMMFRDGFLTAMNRDDIVRPFSPRYSDEGLEERMLGSRSNLQSVFADIARKSKASAVSSKNDGWLEECMLGNRSNLENVFADIAPRDKTSVASSRS